MARKRARGTSGSQFCIFFTEAPGLDGDYTVFGKVIKGMDVVDQFNELSASKNRKDKIFFCVRVVSKNSHPYKVV